MVIDTLKLIDTVIQIDTVFRETVPVLITNVPTKTIWDIIKDYFPLITLIIGAVIGFGVNKFNEYLSFKKSRKYFFFTMFDLNIAVKEQIKIYEDYILFVKSPNNNVPRATLNVGFNVDSIKSVSKEIIYKILVVKGKNILDLSFLEKSFIGLESILRKRTTDFERFFNNNLEGINKFNKLIEKLNGEINLTDEEFNKHEIETREGLVKIFRIYTSFNDNQLVTKQASVFEFMSGLVIPISNILKDEKIKFPRATIQNLISTYQYISEIRNLYSNVIENYIFSLKLVNQHFDKLINIYSKYIDEKQIRAY